MSKPPIWIVNGKLNFEDLMQSDQGYIEGWRCIIGSWLLEPVQHLAPDQKRVTDRGISMLMLLLSFFEPLGSILSGESSDGASKATFRKGFEYFSDWLRERGSGSEINADTVYSFARCGLMHNFTMKGGKIFIDALGVGKTSMCMHDYKLRYTKAKLQEANDRENIYLMDPWRLLSEINEFCDEFCIRLKASKREDSDLYKKFKATFERTIVNPGKIYFS